MYVLWLRNGDPTGMTADFCILCGDGIDRPEEHLRITNIGTPGVPREDGQTLDGCVMQDTQIESCDGTECRSRLLEKQVMRFSPELTTEVRELLKKHPLGRTRV